MSMTYSIAARLDVPWAVFAMRKFLVNGTTLNFKYAMLIMKRPYKGGILCESVPLTIEQIMMNTLFDAGHSDSYSVGIRTKKYTKKTYADLLLIDWHGKLGVMLCDMAQESSNTGFDEPNLHHYAQVLLDLIGDIKIVEFAIKKS